MLNKVCFIGRLGQNPEVKYSADGKAVCSFSIATTDRYTDRDGQKKENTEWVNIVCFDRLAENCARFINKGSLVYVEGKLKTDKWQDKNGYDRYTTKAYASLVQFLDKKDSNYFQNDSHYSPKEYQELDMSTPQSISNSETINGTFGGSSPMDDIPF